MQRILKFVLPVLLLALIVVNVAVVIGMQRKMDTYQSRIHELEATATHERAKIEVLNRFVLSNHKRIKGLQRKRLLTVTAYSPRAQETDSTPNITATNSRVRPGIVAVSRDLFDSGWVFGKKVYIKNFGVFVIDDLMHARKKNQIDIFMTDTDNALDFGRKKLEVYLLDA